jgi:hypothetical protein
MAKTRDEYLKDLEERAEEIKRIRQSSKAARAYARTYKTGPPLVPQYIVNKVLMYISQAQIHKKTEAVLTICKYWSLKREARRGAPLLKRLHLEVSSKPELHIKSNLSKAMDYRDLCCSPNRGSKAQKVGSE